MVTVYACVYKLYIICHACMHVYTHNNYILCHACMYIHFCRQLVIKCISMGTIDINIPHLENSMCAIMAHLAVLL